jgi:hypothetical protein
MLRNHSEVTLSTTICLPQVSYFKTVTFATGCSSSHPCCLSSIVWTEAAGQEVRRVEGAVAHVVNLRPPIRGSRLTKSEQFETQH